MATPFHRPSPWCASSYPASRKASAGASGSASLVSCISSTSGLARSSHHVTFSRRAFSELTFQVAMRIHIDYPIHALILFQGALETEYYLLSQIRGHNEEEIWPEHCRVFGFC